jgi:hypothetical protein
MSKSWIAKRRKGRSQRPRFPGLSKDAEALGVSRWFLYQVLRGWATSAPLLKRYNELKEGAK